jgi:hypothetical protein
MGAQSFFVLSEKWSSRKENGPLKLWGEGLEKKVGECRRERGVAWAR